MIYQIRNDQTGTIVYDPRIPDAVVIDPILDRQDNTFGSLKFKMFPSHPETGSISKRKTIYSVYRNDGQNPIFRGICTEGTEDLDGIVQYYFEDFMSVLRDSMQDPFIWQGSPLDFMRQLITNHNAQVEDWQKITLGHMTVTDPNDYIYRESESELSTWEVIKTRFIDLMGGHLRMRYVNGIAYLDYLEGSTGSTTDPYIDTSTQVIEIGENLKSFSRVISSSATYSACVPKGAEMEFYDDDGNSYKKRLTIETVNEGSKYLIDSDAVALYGFRCAPVSETTWDDVTVPENLIAKGREYLESTLVMLSNTIKLTAIDLNHLGVSSDTFDYLQYVRVSVYTANLDRIYLLTAMTIPLDDPSELSITLGETILTLADRQAKQNAAINTRIETVEQNVASMDPQTAIDNTATELRSLIEQTGSSILSQVSQIYTRSSSFEQYQKEVATALEQTANTFEFQFRAISSQVTNIEGESSSKFSTISKYIRFIDGAIYLGEEGNPLILKISNEKISFFNNNVEIAYFSSGRLYVDRLEAITSLTLGSYAFMPNRTGGMTLKYIGS